MGEQATIICEKTTKSSAFLTHGPFCVLSSTDFSFNDVDENAFDDGRSDARRRNDVKLLAA